MAFLDRFKRKKEIDTKSSLPEGLDLTKLEDRILFKDLLEGYSDTFSVDTPEDALNAYKTIPQLNTVISRSAMAFISAQKNLYQSKKTGDKELVTSGEFYDVLKRPHFLQSENEFWNVLYKNWAIHGVAYVLKGESVGFGLKSLLCLATPDFYIHVKENPDFLYAKEIKDIVSYYEVDDGNGSLEKITELEKIWTISLPNLELRNEGYIKPESPLKTLEKTLGTLDIVNKVRNQLLGDHGAIGIINPEASKDATGNATIFRKQDKKDLHAAYDEYGLMPGKNKLIISNVPLKFTPISLKIAELMLNEFEDQATRTLANNMNFPLALLTDNARYENKDAGNKELYQNKIIPESQLIQKSFNSEFKLKEQNLEFEFDYSDIVYLQTDLKSKAERDKINTEIIISLNESVSDGIMTRDTAINVLIAQGIQESEAPNYISEPMKIKVIPPVNGELEEIEENVNQN